MYGDTDFVSPTDPVLAASVVKGTFAERHVPPFIRDLLLVSGMLFSGLDKSRVAGSEFNWVHRCSC